MWTSAEVPLRALRAVAVAVAVAVAGGVVGAGLGAQPVALPEPEAARRLEPTDLGGVIVSLVVPGDQPYLDADTRPLLEARMAGALAAAGVAGVGSATPFVLYPLVALVDEVRADGGLEARTVARVELTFVVRHVASRAVVHEWSGRFAGTGRTRAEAVRQAIAALAPSHPALREFGAETRRRIVAHYERGCDAVRAGARAAAAAGRGREALAELAAVPTDATTCHALAMRDARALTTAARPDEPRRSPAGAETADGRRATPGRAGALTLEMRRDVAAHFNASRARLSRLDYTRP